MGKLIVKNIGMLATPEGKTARRGAKQGEIRVLKDAYVVIEDGVIAKVGTGAPEETDAQVIDARGRLVTPAWWTPTPTLSSGAGGRTSWG